MWLAYGTWDAPYLERIDPAAVTVADRFELDAESVPAGLVPTAARVWLLYRRAEDAVVAIDPATGDPQPVDLPTTPDSLAPSTDGGVWTVHVRERAVRRLAPTGEVAQVIDLPDGWWTATTTPAGALWLTGSTGNATDQALHVVAP
jgi:streptogramin lyase